MIKFYTAAMKILPLLTIVLSVFQSFFIIISASSMIKLKTDAKFIL